MTAKAYPAGTDCVWLALDQDNHVAAFTTGGSGPIPLKVLEFGEGPADEIEVRIKELPLASAARLLVSLKRPDDFVDFAERGIFAYDWSDVHRMERDEICAYELVAAPSSPINVGQLPSKIAAFAERNKIEGVVFATTQRIDVRKSLNCIERQ